MFIPLFLLGLAVIAFGRYAIKHPDSWLFRGMGEDSEFSSDRLSYNRFGGFIFLILGIIITVLSFQHLFV